MKDILEKKADDAKRAVADAWKGVEEAKQTAEADPTDENRAAYHERYSKYEELVGEHRKLDDELKTELKREIERLGHQNGSAGDAAKANLTPGERAVQSKQYQHLKEQGLLDRGPFRPLQDIPLFSSDEFRKSLAFKTLVTSEGAPGDDILRATRLPGILPLLQAPLTLLDLFSTGTTDGNTIEWVKIDTLTNAAAVVPEATSTSDNAALKPESALTVTVESTAYHTIAHYIPATRQAIADIGEMQTLINNFLIDGVRRELLNEAINGDGTGTLDGIYNVAGLTQAAGSDSTVDAIFRGITAVRNSFHEPTAVAMTPADWTEIRLSRFDQGGGAGTGDYIFGPPSQVGAETLWGVRVVVDPALNDGQPIVGEWDEATLYTREGVRLHTTDSHSDWFRRNIIAILAEGRFALVTRRPNAFCVVLHADYS